MEMLLVLTIISMFMLCIPLLKTPAAITLQYQLQIIEQRLLDAQYQSMSQKTSASVDFQGNSYTIAGKTYAVGQGVMCSHASWRFSPNGNVSKALTLSCSLQNAKKKLVVELGSGRMYVK